MVVDASVATRSPFIASQPGPVVHEVADERVVGMVVSFVCPC